MNKETIETIRPWFEFVFSLLDEIDDKTGELSEVRQLATKLHDEVSAENMKLRQENAAMKSFITDHVSEDLQKLIFKDRSET